MEWIFWPLWCCFCGRKMAWAEIRLCLPIFSLTYCLFQIRLFQRLLKNRFAQKMRKSRKDSVLIQSCAFILILTIQGAKGQIPSDHLSHFNPCSFNPLCLCSTGGKPIHIEIFRICNSFLSTFCIFIWIASEKLIHKSAFYADFVVWCGFRFDNPHKSCQAMKIKRRDLSAFYRRLSLPSWWDRFSILSLFLCVLQLRNMGRWFARGLKWPTFPPNCRRPEFSSCTYETTACIVFQMPNYKAQV